MPRLALLALVLLTGCVTAQDTLTGVEAEPRRRFLTFAGYQSPVLLISVNAPFQLPQPDIAVRLTEHANGSVVGSDVTYTATAAQAKHANYRIVARFDAEQGTDTKDVCKSAFGPTPAARYANRTNLFMAFCDQAEPIAGAKVSGPKLAGLSDPNLREMLRAGMQAMFPSATNSGRTGSMGSIQVNPVPHFRLNPLDGII
jgi:ABC-type amino acid transport substrate-binding protein